jgi:copper transporter 1
MRSKVKTWVKRIETNIWSKFHLVQTLLHCVQMILAYLVMLIFMTYNSWLCAAVIAGLTAGYFCFGWRKTVVLEQSDHCH